MQQLKILGFIARLKRSFERELLIGGGGALSCSGHSSSLQSGTPVVTLKVNHGFEYHQDVRLHVTNIDSDVLTFYAKEIEGVSRVYFSS